MQTVGTNYQVNFANEIELVKLSEEMKTMVNAATWNFPTQVGCQGHQLELWGLTKTSAKGSEVKVSFGCSSGDEIGVLLTSRVAAKHRFIMWSRNDGLVMGYQSCAWLQQVNGPGNGYFLEEHVMCSREAVHTDNVIDYGGSREAVHADNVIDYGGIGHYSRVGEKEESVGTT